MVPFRKMLVSKSVCIIFIFLTSSSFAFLENNRRVDVMSRKSVRDSRSSFNKEYLEDLPFRRDLTRQANEKDTVYENLYDRRSFRTGTIRQTRTDSVRERDSLERSLRVTGNDRSLPNDRLSDNRERYFQERSRTLQGDGTNQRSSRYARENRQRNQAIRQQRIFELKEQASRVSADRGSRQMPDQITGNRNRNSRQGRERSLNFRENEARQNSHEQFRQNRDRFLEENENLFRIFRDNRQYREQRIENPDNFLGRRLPTERSSRLNTIREIRQTTERNFQNLNRFLEERSPNENSFRISRDNRQYPEQRVENPRNFLERKLPTERSSRFNTIREIRQSTERDFEHLNRFLDEPSSNIRSSRLPERTPVREIRQSRQPSFENRGRFLQEMSRNIRSSRGESRERSLVNQDRLSAERSSRISRVDRTREATESTVRNLENQYRLSAERSSRISRVDRTREARESAVRNLENQDRLSVETSSRISGVDRTQKTRESAERNLENQDRLSLKRSSRISRVDRIREARESIVRNLENQYRLSAERSSRISRVDRSREARESAVRNLENQDRLSAETSSTISGVDRARETRKSAERNLENQDRFLADRYSGSRRDDRIRDIRQSPEQRYDTRDSMSPIERTTRTLTERGRSETSRNGDIRQNREDRERQLENRSRDRQYNKNIMENRVEYSRQIRKQLPGNTNRYLDEQSNRRNAEDIRQYRVRSLGNRNRYLEEMPTLRNIPEEIREETRQSRNRKSFAEERYRRVENLDRDSRIYEKTIGSSRLSRDNMHIRNNEIRQYRDQNLENRTPFEDARKTERQYFRRTSDISPENKRNLIFSGRNRVSSQDRTLRDVNIRNNDSSRAGLSRSDSTRRPRNAQSNSQEEARNSQSISCTRKDTSGYCSRRQIPEARESPRRDQITTVRSTRADIVSIDRRLIPIADNTQNIRNRYYVEKIEELRNLNESQKIFKFDTLVNVAQVILGVFLVTQILTHSSKKTAYGFQGLFQSMNYHKQKVE